MKKVGNKGFSIVELVICIAIMGIVIGMMAASLHYIGVSQARSLANSIKTAVGQARVQTMGKYDTYLYIYRSSTDKRYYKETWKRSNQNDLVRENRELLGKDRPMVRYKIKGDSSDHYLDGTNGLLIKFDRTNGKEIEEDMSAAVTTTALKDQDGKDIKGGNASSDTKSVLCNEIIIYYGSKEYKVKIVPATGKISL